jgi:hypothetical protein
MNKVWRFLNWFVFKKVLGDNWWYGYNKKYGLNKFKKYITIPLNVFLFPLMFIIYRIFGLTDSGEFEKEAVNGD